MVPQNNGSGRLSLKVTVPGPSAVMLSMIGNLITLPGATFVTGGGYAVSASSTLNNAGTFQSVGALLVNQGTLLNSGTMLSSLATTGSVSNTGSITGNVSNAGSFANNGVVTGAFMVAATTARVWFICILPEVASLGGSPGENSVR